jgi:hypothetical protein
MNGTSNLSGFLRADPRDVGCAETFSLIDRYLERQLSHGDAAEHYPGITAHLAVCGPCSQDYHGLHALVA